jgi:hypothetical protein
MRLFRREASGQRHSSDSSLREILFPRRNQPRADTMPSRFPGHDKRDDFAVKIVV